MESAKIESLLGSTARYLKQRQHKEAARNLEELKIILRGKRDKIVEKELDIVVVLADTIGNCDGALEPLISVISAYCLLPDGIDRVGKTNATSQLLLILKYPKSESLSTRGLRLLGNLAQNVSIAEKLHREGATATVMSFVKNPEHSVETLTMAVRVMRLLWMVKDKREEMLKAGAIESIVTLLTKECETLNLINRKSKEASSKQNVTKRNNKQLIDGILKCILCISTVLSPESVVALQGDGRGFDCIVILAEDYEIMAMKCIVNLCRIVNTHHALGVAGAVDVLVEKLKKQTNWCNEWVKALCLLCDNVSNRVRIRKSGGLRLLLDIFQDNTHTSRSSTVLHAFMHFTYDEKSIKILIREGIVSIITDQLKEYVSTMKCSHKFYDKSRNIKTNNTCSNKRKKSCAVKNDELKINQNDAKTSIMGSDSSDYQEDTDSICTDPAYVTTHTRKRKKNTSESSKKIDVKEEKVDWNLIDIFKCVPLSQNSCNCIKTDYSSTNLQSQCMHLIHCLSPGTSPRSDVNRAESSDPPSPTVSSTSTINREYDSEDSEKSTSYSPVCYDTDENPEETNIKSEDIVESLETANELDDLTIEEESTPKDDTILENKCQSSRHKSQCLLVLLSRISHHPTWQSDYTPSQKLLDLLISYICLTKNPVGRASRILTRFLSLPTNLMSILQKSFIFKLDDLKNKPVHKKCDQCKKVTKLSTDFLTEIKTLVESDYGIGVISRQFLVADFRMKQKLALILPVVVSSERILRKHFMHHNGLNLLFSTLTNDKTEIENCINALSYLARSLSIKNPITLENKFEDHITVQYDPLLDNLDPENLVTFVLDDESKVIANREFLCEQSEVFRAMLAGQFKESTEEFVTLKNATKDGLEYLFLLLHYGANDNNNTFETFPFPKKLDTTFDTLLLADRFLMENLKNLLLSGIIQFKMNFLTADQMYIWSLKDGMGLLCVESAAYILTGKMEICDRTKIFSKIMETIYRQQWLDDIKSIIERHFHMA